MKESWCVRPLRERTRVRAMREGRGLVRGLGEIEGAGGLRGHALDPETMVAEVA